MAQQFPIYIRASRFIHVIIYLRIFQRDLHWQRAIICRQRTVILLEALDPIFCLIWAAESKHKIFSTSAKRLFENSSSVKKNALQRSSNEIDNALSYKSPYIFLPFSFITIIITRSKLPFFHYGLWSDDLFCEHVKFLGVNYYISGNNLFNSL